MVKFPACGELIRKATKALIVLTLLLPLLAPLYAAAWDAPDDGSDGHTPDCDESDCISTGIGCIPTSNVSCAAGWILKKAIYVAFLCTLLLLIWGGLAVASSTGDPERVAAGRAKITAAVSGLLFILLSVLILHIIGADILKIFSRLQDWERDILALERR